MDSFFECSNCGYRIVNFTEDDYLDDFGSLCYCQVEAHQEEDSTTEKEEEEMTPNNEKTAAEGATSTTANESLPKDSVTTVYLLKHSESTRHTFGTWSGKELPRDKYFPVLIECDAVAAIWSDSTGQITFNADCIETMEAEAIKRRQSEQKLEQRRRDEANRRREEYEIIHRITGIDLSRDDLVVFMTQARRAGENFQPFLDALQAIDDLDLKRAGLTSWDDDLDELDAEGVHNDRTIKSV
ncbi:hypothetical protein [Corynebacterium casei]|uniref:hypothetical protein n=1 Tax=Corynebacterium casei TaxID=160386 RepID=UPI003FCFC4C7